MPNIGAVILAAGESSRLGQPKQLIRFRGRSLVQRAVDAAADADCWPIVIVIGGHNSDVAVDLPQTATLVVENEDWRNGIGTSIRRGIRGLIEAAPELEAAVLLVCDQPFLHAALIKRLILCWTESARPIVASGYADTLGVPALFGRMFFKVLLALPDNCGAKGIIFRNRDQVAAIPFPEGKIDIDTTEDLERLSTERERRD